MVSRVVCRGFQLCFFCGIPSSPVWFPMGFRLVACGVPFAPRLVSCVIRWLHVLPFGLPTLLMMLLVLLLVVSHHPVWCPMVFRVCFLYSPVWSAVAYQLVFCGIPSSPVGCPMGSRMVVCVSSLSSRLAPCAFRWFRIYCVFVWV